MPKLRKDLCADALIAGLRSNFSKVDDSRNGAKISLTDTLMSGYAIFSLKYPSLLSFEKSQKMQDPGLSNMPSLFGVEQVPSDTNMRKVIDDISTDSFRPAFKGLFNKLQRGKALNPYKFIDGKYLISIDGTGLFSSKDVSGACCMEKVSRKDGSKTFYHQMLGVVMVHPDKKEVIPFCPEAIQKQDGTSKNDCERNACKRAIEKFRQDHPKLDAIILEDGLSSNAPHIEMLKNHNLSFILGAKPGDHKHLFELASLSGENQKHLELTTEDGFIHHFRFVNDLGLNEANDHLKVNFLEYDQYDPKKKKLLKFSWVTDIKLTSDNVFKIMRAGRSRWKIENETFNTLKNQGYNFEHNYGHGKKNLCTNFAHLMFLAFAVDQIQQVCCKVFREARQQSGAFYQFCANLISCFMKFDIPSWAALLEYIARPIRVALPTGPP